MSQRLPNIPVNFRNEKTLLYLCKVSDHTAVHFELNEVTKHILRHSLDFFGFLHGLVFTKGSQSDWLKPIVYQGEPDLYRLLIRMLNDPQEFCHTFIERKKSIAGDMEDRRGNHYTLLGVPLLFKGEVLGGMVFVDGDPTILERSGELLDYLAVRLGLGFKNFLDHEKLRSLSKEVKRLSRVPHQSPNPIFCCDRNGAITFRNDAMVDFLKAQRMGISRNIRDLLEPDDPAIAEIIEAIDSDSESISRELSIGGRVLLGAISNNKKTEEAIVFMQDVTEIKHIAQQMVQKNMELIQTKSELEIQTRRAVEANRHKTEFLTSMSHELRTPLNSVIGFSEILQDELFGPLNEKQAEYVTDILESGRHLLSLINDILDLTKIEAGKMELYPAEIFLPELVQSTTALMSETAARHRIELVIDMDDTVQLLTGDERKIKQVLFNLVSNAIKFTPDGGTITIHVTQDERGTTISVKDTGIGIAEEHQDSIFTEFKQVDSSLTRHFDGVGLGLAIVKRFVELHGGTIQVESKVGEGSRFFFFIPLEIPAKAE